MCRVGKVPVIGRQPDKHAWIDARVNQEFERVCNRLDYLDDLLTKVVRQLEIQQAEIQVLKSVINKLENRVDLPLFKIE